jgi:selenocysteine lyase/cysteine desulfurase
MISDDLELPKLAVHGMALLEIENLHVKIDGEKIVKGVDLAVNAGEVHAIMGPDGSGKSALAYVLVGKDDVATVINRSGVAVRGGNHCVMPFLGRFGVTATCRASFALYNTRAGVDILAQAPLKAQEFFT